MNPTKQLSMRGAVEIERAKKTINPTEQSSMRKAVERERVKTVGNPKDFRENEDYERRFEHLKRACVNFPFCTREKNNSEIYDIPEENILPPNYEIVCIDFDTRETHSKNTVYFQRIERNFFVGAIRGHGNEKMSKIKIKVLHEDGTVPNGYRLWIYERQRIS